MQVRKPRDDMIFSSSRVRQAGFPLILVGPRWGQSAPQSLDFQNSPAPPPRPAPHWQTVTGKETGPGVQPSCSPPGGEVDQQANPCHRVCQECARTEAAHTWMGAGRATGLPRSMTHDPDLKDLIVASQPQERQGVSHRGKQVRGSVAHVGNSGCTPSTEVPGPLAPSIPPSAWTQLLMDSKCSSWLPLGS